MGLFEGKGVGSGVDLLEGRGVGSAVVGFGVGCKYNIPKN